MQVRVPLEFALSGCMLPCVCVAQQAAPVVAPQSRLPDSPLEGKASISGTITDQDGSLLPGAHVTVVMSDEKIEEIADNDGEFHAEGLPAGLYTVRVGADGFAEEDESGLLQPDEQKDLPPIGLRMTSSRAAVTVFATQHEVAAAEVAAEEKQRVLGIIPNFYVVYSPHPTPLSAGQKFHLAWRSTLDPISFVGAAFVAGIQQNSDDFSGYGQGSTGYAKRYAANFTDSAVSGFLGGAILPTLFHQDPRYFYQGTGTTGSRLRHAVSSVFICRGDNGKREFNYSNVLGNFAGAGLSNLYYPATDRHGAGLTLGNAAVDFGFGSFSAVMQEFVIPKLTPHLPRRGTASGK